MLRWRGTVFGYFLEKAGGKQDSLSLTHSDVHHVGSTRGVVSSEKFDDGVFLLLSRNMRARCVEYTSPRFVDADRHGDSRYTYIYFLNEMERKLRREFPPQGFGCVKDTCTDNYL